MTCDGVANFARKCWLTQKMTKTQDGQPYNFKEVSISSVLDMVTQNEILPETFRKLARSYPFRGMWNLSKKTGDLFGGSAIDVDKNKLALISYAQMYDNVYENPESPKDEVIEDDDCLDGWFILQRRKIEKDKKQAEADALISNEKIANSSEIFLMAKNQEDVNNIYDLNDPVSRAKIKQRESQIESEGSVKFADLHDVRQEMYIESRQKGMEQIKSRAGGGGRR